MRIVSSQRVLNLAMSKCVCSLQHIPSKNVCMKTRERDPSLCRLWYRTPGPIDQKKKFPHQVVGRKKEDAQMMASARAMPHPGKKQKKVARPRHFTAFLAVSTPSSPYSYSAYSCAPIAKASKTASCVHPQHCQPHYPLPASTSILLLQVALPRSC